LRSRTSGLAGRSAARARRVRRPLLAEEDFMGAPG
jgi:hypothetical protein